MTLTAAESIRSNWTGIFRRKGGDGTYTRLFENLDAMQQNALLRQIDLREWEFPVVGSFQNPDNWLILTTERLVWSIAADPHEINVHVVRDAVADFDQLQYSGRSKLELRELKVLTIDGGERRIELESGPPLSGVWNILKSIGARNRARLKMA